MKIFDFGEEAYGFIAVGQVATGVFAFGQMATGVVAVGQLARGVVAVGQLAIGVVVLGQGALGVMAAMGMLAVGARARGLVPISLVPKYERIAAPALVDLAAIASGAVVEGWVRLRIEREARGELEWSLDGRRVEVRADEHACAGVFQAAASSKVDVYARLRREARFDAAAVAGLRDAAAVHYELACVEVQPVPKPRRPGLLGWAVRVMAMAGLAATFWFAVVEPLADAFAMG